MQTETWDKSVLGEIYKDKLMPLHKLIEYELDVCSALRNIGSIIGPGVSPKLFLYRECKVAVSYA